MVDDRPQLRTSLRSIAARSRCSRRRSSSAPSLDAADRKAAIFEFEVPADQFKPGLYTCQVNVIDEVAGQFTFPRLDMYVRPAAKTEK